MAIPEQFIRSPYEVNESVNITVRRVANSDAKEAPFKGIGISFTDKGKKRTEDFPEDVYFYESISQSNSTIQVGETITSEVGIRKIYKDNVSYELQKVTILESCIINGTPQDHCVIDFTTKTKI